MPMNPKIFILIGFLAIAAVLLVAAAYIPNGVVLDLLKLLLLALAMAFTVAAFASRYYSYLLIPMLQQRRRHIVLSDQPPYWLASTGDAIVVKKDNDFIATTYINIPIYVSGSEMSNEERQRFSYQISNLISVSKEPARFSTELRIMDKGEYLKLIKEAIGNAENELSALEKSEDVLAKDRARGKLSMWKKVLDHISSKSSMELVTFVTVSAIASKEYEAIMIAQQKARELMNGIGTILGVTPNVSVGGEVLKLVEPEYLIPLSTISQEIEMKIEHGVVE
jgi:hypothetical protein